MAAFDALVANVSTRLANVSLAGLPEEADATLRRLVSFLGYDRCTYGEFGGDGLIYVQWSASSSGVAPHPPGAFGRDLTWFTGELRRGRVLALSDLPACLPAEAVAEAQFVRTTGLRSNLSIPLRIGGRIAGVLSFAATTQARVWPDEIVRRLTLIGEMLGGAIARARLEEQSEHLRTRLWHADRAARTSALTAAIAHEINQPLAAILGNAQAALAWLDRGDVTAEKLRGALEAVVREDKRAADTIRSLRALLRQDDSGRTCIDLAAAIDEVVRLLLPTLRRQGVRVHTHYAPGCLVLANRIQVEQVALNLLQNATEALQVSPRNERELVIAVARTDRGTIRASVSDTGPGVATEHRADVFEPFWTTRQDGLGLGLAICRSIVEAHQGSIEVEPNSPHGATFVVELAASPAPERLGFASAESATHAALAAGEVVCIVDDDPAVREGLIRLLDACGCAAVSFGSGAELFEHWPIADVGCMLLDLRLPGMTGLEIQQRLEALGASVPVVFMTGHGDVASSVEAMKLGAVDFLAKPVDQTVLVDVIRRALSLGVAERRRAAERERCNALLARLSPREREIATHVVRGRLNKQIAADLGISEQTVKQHRGRVMEKLEVRSVADLVRVCELAETPPAQADPVRAAPRLIPPR